MELSVMQCLGAKSSWLRATRSRVILLATLATLAVSVTGCGTDDGDPKEESQQGTPSQTAVLDTSADDKTGNGGTTGVRGSGPTLQGDRAQARAGAGAVDDVYEDLRSAIDAGVASNDVGVVDTLDAAAKIDSLTKVCDLMSEQARRRTVDYAERSAGLADVDWTCEKATALLLRRSGRARGMHRAMRVTVVGVNAEGDRATATVRFGGKRGRLSTIPLVKEDGRWKIGNAPGGNG